jgi:putative spermidine/putrescine transport system ATP-binding protein
MAASHGIRIRDVRKAYGSVVALASIDLDVRPGEYLTLLGPSGSGKTTLLMIIAGFTRPDRGSIEVGGREFVTLPPHKRDIGLVFQNYALFPHMTVAENVAFPLRYHGVSRGERAGRVRQALALVRLDGFESRHVDQLSGGQKQRVALARALVFEPALLLMDEPLSALDKKLREQMQGELRELHRQVGTTTIYVTHDQREALNLGTRVAVMNEGAIVQIGTPAEVYEQPNSLFVADFIGQSQFVRVALRSAKEACLGDAVLRLARPAGRDSGTALLLLRPDKLELLGEGQDWADLNVVAGRVTDVVYQGEQVLVSVALVTGETVVVRRGTGARSMAALPDRGQRVVIGLHPDDTLVVPEPEP